MGGFTVTMPCPVDHTTAPPLDDLPDRMRTLPRDRHGRPIPWFVAMIDGLPDFRVIRRGGIADAYRDELCWVCGQRRGAYAAFLIGPMCAVNRISAELPSHRDCAVWSAKNCPFLSRPDMVRRDRHLPEEHHVAGVMIERNPGVALVWVTKKWRPVRVPDGSGTVFQLGDPEQTLWFARGRDATRAEILESMESGLPILKAADGDNPAAHAQLDADYRRALTYVPAV